MHVFVNMHNDNSEIILRILIFQLKYKEHYYKSKYYNENLFINNIKKKFLFFNNYLEKIFNV